MSAGLSSSGTFANCYTSTDTIADTILVRPVTGLNHRNTGTVPKSLGGVGVKIDNNEIGKVLILTLHKLTSPGIRIYILN